MENSTVIEVNVKTRYRPFKRCFKYQTNTITKLIINIINKAQFNKTPKVKNSTTRSGNNRVNYASIKGFCKLKRNGQLY